MKHWRKRERVLMMSINPAHHVLVILCLLIGLPVSIGLGATIAPIGYALGVDSTIVSALAAGFVGAIFYAVAGNVLIGPVSGVLWGAVWSLASILWIFATASALSISPFIIWDMFGIIIGSLSCWQLIQSRIRRHDVLQRIKIRR